MFDQLTEIDVADLGGEPTRTRDLRARGRETVGKLLRAGHEVVEERGHDNARVDDIVDRAEVSHGTFYLYFRDREDLLESLVRLVAEAVAPLADRLPRDGDFDALAAWFDDAETVFDRHVEVLRAAHSLGDDGAVSGLVEPLAAALQAAGGTDTRMVAQIMTGHFARAIVRADILDPQRLARITLSAAGVATPPAEHEQHLVLDASPGSLVGA